VRNLLGIWAGLLVLAAASCSHHPKHETVLRFDAELSRRLGQAKRADVLALMGEPTAQEQIGDIEVWTYFYEHSGAKSRTKPEVALVAPDHDGLILSFDREGTLQHYNVILEGRVSERGRSR
jgi:outer membrane protein assembly factor BamE (lipoprotein component of BamABCDE complex)